MTPPTSHVPLLSSDNKIQLVGPTPWLFWWSHIQATVGLATAEFIPTDHMLAADS